LKLAPSPAAGRASLVRTGAALVCALPWLRSLAGTHAPEWARRLVDEAFLPLCHHWPLRVLVLGGEAMCVCSRCAGLYGGLAVGFAFGKLAPLEPRTLRLLFGIGLASMLLDVVTQDAGLHAPSHLVRLSTGAFLGWVVATWMVQATSQPRRSPAMPQRG